MKASNTPNVPQACPSGNLLAVGTENGGMTVFDVRGETAVRLFEAVADGRRAAARTAAGRELLPPPIAGKTPYHLFYALLHVHVCCSSALR